MSKNKKEEQNMKWHGFDVEEFVGPLDSKALNDDDFPATYYEDGQLCISIAEPLPHGGSVFVKFDDIFTASMIMHQNTLGKKDLLREIDGCICGFEKIIVMLKKQKKELLCKTKRNTP